MAMPGPIVVLLAKSYAHRLSVKNPKTGVLYTPDEAKAYISKHFGHVTRAQIRGAIHQATRALQIGEKIKDLRANDKLSEALEGERRPASRVGVRVRIYRTMRGDKIRINDLYLDMSWSDTKMDVAGQVAQWIKATAGVSGKAKAYGWEFSGPTRWPAHYP